MVLVSTTRSSGTDGSRKRQGSRGARRLGYLIGAAVNVAFLYLLNVAPGWDALPFLTADTTSVLGAVNATLVAGVVANLVYVAADPRWLRALGDVVTAAVGLVAALRVWSVFPFDLPSTGDFDWSLIARIAVGLAIAGSFVAILIGVASFLRALARRG